MGQSGQSKRPPPTLAVAAVAAGSAPRRRRVVLAADRPAGDPASALPGNLQADVAIIGAGYTGLWTAYYLRKAAPQLRVVVLEKEFAGFGASGRNGGWCMGVMAWDQNRYAATHGREAVLDMVSALEGAVPEIARVCAAEGIDADLRETEEP